MQLKYKRKLHEIQIHTTMCVVKCQSQQVQIQIQIQIQLQIHQIQKQDFEFVHLMLTVLQPAHVQPAAGSPDASLIPGLYHHHHPHHHRYPLIPRLHHHCHHHHHHHNFLDGKTISSNTDETGENSPVTMGRY